MPGLKNPEVCLNPAQVDSLPPGVWTFSMNFWKESQGKIGFDGVKLLSMTGNQPPIPEKKFDWGQAGIEACFFFLMGVVATILFQSLRVRPMTVSEQLEEIHSIEEC